MTISAKIIADSISPGPAHIRITTFQLRYPRFIHAEFMTHRQFSRNASSSRAVPVIKLVQDIIEDTAMPIHWGRNQPGMQANGEHDALIGIYNDVTFTELQGGARNVFQELNKVPPQEAWFAARDLAIESALAFAEAGYHKQIVNRLLEPFSHINVIVTSTEWSNFFRLRIDPGAQPEIQELAKQMKAAMDESKPRHLLSGQWHLPYIRDEDFDIIDDSIPGGRGPAEVDLILETAIKCSVARCARVSYMTHDMKKPTLEEDIALYDRLLGAQPIHASPAEHQATPDDYVADTTDWRYPELHGNFNGWKQYRKTLVGECQ